MEGLLVPSHISTTFHQSGPRTNGLDSTANFVSATNLVRECPCSLLTALANNHPDQKTWLESYIEEKLAIQSLNTYKRLTLAEYCSL